MPKKLQLLTPVVTSINGQTGDVSVPDEVYVGSVEPTDENIKVWVDPEGGGELLQPLTGTTMEITPARVHQAILAGTPVVVKYTDGTYGELSFTNFNVANGFMMIVSQTIVYYNSNYILAELAGNLNGGWAFNSTALAEKKNVEVFYIDLAGKYPNYTCPVAMADIQTAYEEGKVLKCRCDMSEYTVTLPLLMSLSSSDVWIFSCAVALHAFDLPEETVSIGIFNGTVVVSITELASKDDIPTVPTTLPNPNTLTFTGAVSDSYDGSKAKTVNIPTVPMALKNPNALTIKIGDTSVTYDGSTAKTVEISDGTEVSY